METETLAPIEAASPDLEKQGAAVVFVNREYSRQPDPQGHAQIREKSKLEQKRDPKGEKPREKVPRNWRNHGLSTFDFRFLTQKNLTKM